MSSRHDRLRLHGLESPSGSIRARERHEVLSLLPATSGRTVRGLESDRLQGRVNLERKMVTTKPAKLRENQGMVKME